MISDLNNKKSKNIFKSSSKPIPKFIEPIKGEVALDLINAMVTELNDNFLIELNTTVRKMLRTMLMKAVTSVMI
jgi:hypothetical protein